MRFNLKVLNISAAIFLIVSVAPADYTREVDYIAGRLARDIPEGVGMSEGSRNIC